MLLPVIHSHNVDALIATSMFVNYMVTSCAVYTQRIRLAFWLFVSSKLAIA